MLKLTNQKTTYKKVDFVMSNEFEFLNYPDKYLLYLDTNQIQKANILYDELLLLFKQIKKPVTIDFQEIQKINPDIILRALNTTFYQLTDFKTSRKNQDFSVCLLNITDQKLKEYEIKFEAINNARYLDDLPPNIATPKYIANFIQKQSAEIPNLKVKILGKKELEELKMGLVLAVNSGSINEPRFVVLEYLPSKKQEIDAVLVGKGITMDTGGYNLKINHAQTGMKLDMCGASLVLNSLIALAKLKSQKNLVAIAPLTENCIGYGSTLVDNIAYSYSGQSVEINNTDAEGRLVLADAISYAIKNYQVKEIVDYATLTGSVAAALGIKLTGAFTNHLSLFKKFEEKAIQTGEPIWLLPIQKYNYDNMQSVFADLKNASANANYGVGNAAAFLETFTKKTHWLHLDIAGTAHQDHLSTGILVDTTIEFYK